MVNHFIKGGHSIQRTPAMVDTLFFMELHGQNWLMIFTFRTKLFPRTLAWLERHIKGVTLVKAQLSLQGVLGFARLNLLSWLFYT